MARVFIPGLPHLPVAHRPVQSPPLERTCGGGAERAEKEASRTRLRRPSPTQVAQPTSNNLGATEITTGQREANFFSPRLMSLLCIKICANATRYNGRKIYNLIASNLLLNSQKYVPCNLQFNLVRVFVSDYLTTLRWLKATLLDKSVFAPNRLKYYLSYKISMCALVFLPDQIQNFQIVEPPQQASSQQSEEDVRSAHPIEQQPN